MCVSLFLQDDDEADTVGCCSLKMEHVTLIPPKSLQVYFLNFKPSKTFHKLDIEYDFPLLLRSLIF